MTSHQPQPVLSLVCAAAGGVDQLHDELVHPFVDREWVVTTTATPTAARWLHHSGDAARIEQTTGYAVRSMPRMPDEPSPHPEPTCYAVVPATANTVAKLALGIADNQALTTLHETLGRGHPPIILFPRVNAAHAAHPAWDSHLATLRGAGVQLLYGEDIWPLHQPRSQPSRRLPWQTIRNAILDQARC